MSGRGWGARAAIGAAWLMGALGACALEEGTPVRRTDARADRSATEGGSGLDAGGGGIDAGGGGMDAGTFGTDAGGTGADGRVRINPDAFFAEDPPPVMCLSDGGRVPVDVGVNPATDDPRCPPDKNREGCPCARDGMTASCWTGLRINRGRGQCRDGMTTCQGGEFPVWGPCQGAVLPTPGVTRGPGACNCFSEGTWNIVNVSPCFIYADAAFTRVLGASSSIDLGGGRTSCGPSRMGMAPWPPPAPTWSSSTLTVDCGGTFRVCYRLRAYAAVADAMSMMARPDNCVLSESCVETTIAPTMMATPRMLPPLPGWSTSTAADLACAQRFVDNGGYGEMTVRGLSSECQEFNDGMGGSLVFNRVNYCPAACSRPSPPAMCAMCRNGASGGF
jgi:hypothetical protein